MEPDDPSLRSVRVTTVLVVYLVTAVVPCALLAFGTGGWSVATVSMSGGGTHFAPWVDHLAGWSTVALRIAAPLSLGPALLFVRRIPGVPWRIGVATALALVHLVLVALSWLPTAAVAVHALDGEVRVAQVAAPRGGRRATLYRDVGSCTWTTWITEPLDPVATQHSQVACACENMPEATLVWTGPDPALLDANGMPYTCPNPPSCATGPVPAGLLALCLAAGLTRRRPRAVPRPGSTTAPPAPRDRRSSSA